MNPFKFLVLPLALISSIAAADSRTEMTTTQVPFTTVGRVNTSEGGCTGTLIYKNLVLTNARCLLDSEGKLTTESVTFYATYNGGKSGSDRYSHKANGTHVWVGTTEPYIDAVNDWGIIRLDWDIGYKVGWFGVDNKTAAQVLAYAEDRILHVVSYPSDLSDDQVPFVEENCSFTETANDDTLVVNNCDMSAGSEGSPIFYFLMDKGERTFRILGLTTVDGENYNVTIPGKSFFAKMVELMNEDPRD